ncbi:hypothetical protein FDUTEX481_03372 [Tolypothrix sp. PCC 7601]|nr:hypothetical protein FDUTEX481_03372 [Tolypothrix sp. PCC 7601]
MMILVANVVFLLSQSRLKNPSSSSDNQSFCLPSNLILNNQS